MHTLTPSLSNDNWVIFKIEKNLWALSGMCVQEMLLVPSINKVPELPAYFRGVMNLRGRVIPVVDMRIFLGLSSNVEGMRTMMAARKQDHINWITELKASVTEKRPFKLTTDPHKCKFGLWYDSYQPDSLLLSALLRQFDAPHKAIHAVGSTVNQCCAQQHYDQALTLIEQTWDNELQNMVRLFDQLSTSLEEAMREIIIVIKTTDRYVGLAVDSVLGVETLTDIAPPPSILESEEIQYLSNVAHSKDGSQVFLLDENRLPFCV